MYRWLALSALLATGVIVGMAAQYAIDCGTIKAAHENEAQAQGLEDQCKAALHSPVSTTLIEKPNGDYTLAIYGGRKLVCEEQPLSISSDGDAVHPIVIDCQHPDFNPSMSLARR